MKAEIIINKNFETGKIDNRIYGSFLEHVGRAVYGGIYEPSHKCANSEGFREDVLELVKKLNVPVIRYPGGNFVSGYMWEDGTGDKSKRPRRQDLAWRTVETNEVGIDEFQKWADMAGSGIIMAVNAGTRGPMDAKNLVEYCNGETDTYYANMRRKNGFEKPFGIKTWCIGNEMDGDWQIGHKTADEYGRVAQEAGKLMKLVDPSIELVACGSSDYNIKTFGEWEYTVLDHAYNVVDYISLHQYYKKCDNPKDFLGRTVHMDGFIKSVAAIADAVKAKKHSDKTINLSFDEWNVWHSNGCPMFDWEIAPPLYEDVYSFEDALLVGSMLITLQNNCDRVKIACLAQLVNVIAPIMTENGGDSWVQTTFYPFMYSSVNGRGTVLKSVIKCDSYKTSDNLTVPYIDASVINNKENRELILFVVNRNLEEDMETGICLGEFETAVLKEHIVLYSDNLKSVNTKGKAEVIPENAPVCEISGDRQSIVFKKHSWNMLRFEY